MENLIVVRGGGDLATGTIYKLSQCGFPVLILETRTPSAIRRNVCFSEAVYQRADAKISLSQMTFSHQMIRLLFVEQLYRAMTILRGEPYHHE